VTGMPYGLAVSPDGPKSGCNLRVDPPIAESHAALWTSTGSDAMSACQ
jgi:hypothetical protein